METITYAVDGAVATITLSRPQVRNAMNGRMIEELRQTLEAVNLDTAVRWCCCAAKDRCSAPAATCATCSRTRTR